MGGGDGLKGGHREKGGGGGGGDGTGCSSTISPLFTLRVGLMTAACGWARTACS